MDNCNDCASLCCIAPTISQGGSYEDYGSIIVKNTNQRCTHLLECGECGIYNSRGYTYRACVGFTCHGFGPRLTDYLRRNNLILENGLLSHDGMHLFEILNGMLQLTFHGNNNSDLSDALKYYDQNKDWPKWMTSDEYYDYIFKPGLMKPNPRKGTTIKSKLVFMLKRI